MAKKTKGEGMEIWQMLGLSTSLDFSTTTLSSSPQLSLRGSDLGVG